MTTIVNNNKIPEPIFLAIKGNWYSGHGADHFCSATGLIKPAKMFVLEQRHDTEIEEEADGMVWSLMGSAMHKVLEKSESETAIVENRLYADIDGKVLSGGIDHYEKGTITDFKFTSVWTYIFGSRIKEWTEQLNIYSYLYQKADFPVTDLRIIAIFRDWQKSKFKYESGYPKQIVSIPIKLWPYEKTEQFIKKKMQEVEEALTLPDDDITPCSHLDRWQKPDKYAVMKQGGARALKLFDNPNDAEQFMAAHKDKDQLFLENRTSEPVRCLEYCSCNQFCNYYQQYIATHEVKPINTEEFKATKIQGKVIIMDNMNSTEIISQLDELIASGKLSKAEIMAKFAGTEPKRIHSYTLKFTDEEKRQMVTIADERKLIDKNSSVAAVIREAVENYLQQKRMRVLEKAVQ